uniref:Uncharacterized protein n=1 Tax=Sinocyclocheilus anshuiensis TaxID=1608454 RepID=A0A671KYH8_9TELE
MDLFLTNIQLWLHKTLIDGLESCRLLGEKNTLPSKYNTAAHLLCAKFYLNYTDGYWKNTEHCILCKNKTLGF